MPSALPSSSAHLPDKPLPAPWPLWRVLLWAACIVAGAWVAYQPALDGGWVWDDDAWTTGIAGALADAGGLWRMWSVPTTLQQYFPLTGTTFWIDHHLWGDWTLPYHLENVLLHLGAVMLFWRLLVRLQVPGGWLAAAVLAWHPVMVESVGWITERKNVLSLLLMLAAMLAHLRCVGAWREAEQPAQPRWGWWWLGLLLFVFSLLAKASTFAMPAMLLVLAWWKTGRVDWRRDGRPLLLHFALSLLFCAGISWLERHHVGAEGPEWEVPWSHRVLVAGRVLGFYLGKLCWPAGLVPIYPRWQIDASDWGQWLHPLAAGLSAGCLFWQRRRIGRGVVAALLLYVGPLFPALGFVAMYGTRYSFVSDRWVYLPSLGLIALAAAAVVSASQRWPGLRGLPAIVVLGLLPMLVGLSRQRAGCYRDMETFYQTAIAGNARCWVAYGNLGNERYQAGRFDEAKPLLLKALELYPGYAKAHTNLGSLYQSQGRDDEAEPHLRQAIAAMPELAAAHYNLGLVLLHRHDLAAARDCFQKAADMSPDFVQAHNNLAYVLMEEGKVAAAIEHYRAVIRLQPNDIAGYRNLAIACYRAGDIAALLQAHACILQLAPDDVIALNATAWILATCPADSLRNGSRALALAERAVDLTEGKDAHTLQTLAAATAELGHFGDAIAYCRQALDWAGNDAGLLQAITAAQKSYQASLPLREPSLEPK